MAYLFLHFTNGENGDREHVWFSVSKDGLNWQDIGTDEPVLSSEIGTTGVRDPFIVYDEKLKKFFIIATDLCTVKGGNWDDFSKRGSKCLVVWESTDLINWSKEKLISVGIENAGCVWAPEAVYSKEENKWFVFFASCTKENENEDYKQRIYASFTEDFNTFSETFKYIDAETDVIDTDIVWDNGYYYRFSKDETNKFITLERSTTLLGEFEKVDSALLSSFTGVEGPQAYYLEQQKKWCLIVDQYSSGKGYTPILCDNLSSGDFYFAKEDSYNMGQRKKRHGSVLKIDDNTYNALIKHYGI